MYKFLFYYNKFIICLYMFRALCAHHQEVKIILNSLWYHHNLYMKLVNYYDYTERHGQQNIKIIILIVIYL